MAMNQAGDVDEFDADAARGGYVYTRDDKLSCRLARQRHLDALLKEVDLNDRKVVDLGCGDGYMTVRLYDAGRPAAMVGIDPAPNAIAVARANQGDRDIQFTVADAENSGLEGDAFDIGLLVGVIHHTARPTRVIAEALRVARELVLLEPNGWSPVLKVIEKTSPYHRAHNEKSYSAKRLQYWLDAAGARVAAIRFAGLVPFFCPDLVAAGLKRLEPIVEGTPALRNVACAFTVIRAVR